MFKISGIFAGVPPEHSHLFAGEAGGRSRAKVPGPRPFSPRQTPTPGVDIPNIGNGIPNEIKGQGVIALVSC